MAYEIMTKDGGGGPVAKPSPVPAGQQFNKGEDKKAIFEGWSKERQEEYVQGRKDLLERMEKSGTPLSPYFQALKEGIAAVDNGKKTWAEVYETTVNVSEKMQAENGGRVADGRSPEVAAGSGIDFKSKAVHRTGIDLSNIKGDDNSLARQEYGG